MMRAALLCLTLLLSLAGCKVDLYTQLTEREANQMVAILLQQGIAAEKMAAADGTLSVRIEEADFADAVEQLDARGFPKQKFATLGEVFAESGLVSTPVEERAKLGYAISQELSQTISEIDGVLSARVHVVLPSGDPMDRQPRPASASVAIHQYADRPLAEVVPQIKTLVANSVEGLVYDNVTVVLFPVERPVQAAAATDGTPSAIAAPFQGFGGGDAGVFAAAGGTVLALLLLVGGGLQIWRQRQS